MISRPASAVLATLTFWAVSLIPALAQPVTAATFNGHARIGNATRDVVFRFSCARDGPRINNLAVEMDVPAAEGLKATFDFDLFEGPAGIGGKHHLTTSAGAATSRMDFGSTGSYGNNGSPDSTFTFSAGMTPDQRSRANLQHLQAIVTTLASGPSHFTYRIENPRPGGAPIEAAADLTDGEAARVKAATMGCKRSSY